MARQPAAHAVEGLDRLLGFACDRDKAHPRLLHRTADGARIGLITFIRLHPRLHILGSHQAHRVAKRF